VRSQRLARARRDPQVAGTGLPFEVEQPVPQIVELIGEPAECRGVALLVTGQLVGVQPCYEAQLVAPQTAALRSIRQLIGEREVQLHHR